MVGSTYLWWYTLFQIRFSVFGSLLKGNIFSYSIVIRSARTVLNEESIGLFNKNLFEAQMMDCVLHTPQQKEHVQYMFHSVGWGLGGSGSQFESSPAALQVIAVS